MLSEIHKALSFISNALHSVLMTFFVGVVTLMLAVWLTANLWVGLGAAAVGLITGAGISKRLFFTKEAPAVEVAMPESRFPGVQDEFERLRTRQIVLGCLLIAAGLFLAALRFAYRENWPTLFGVPRERLLVGALAALAVVIPLGILNWRCPNCRRNMGPSLKIRQCPRCGIVLRG